MPTNARETRLALLTGEVIRTESMPRPRLVASKSSSILRMLSMLMVCVVRADEPKSSPTQKLIRDGFVVFDNVLSPKDVSAVRASAEKLLADGRMRHLGQDGRDDHIVALAPGALQHDTEQYGSLVLAARVLMSLPSMLVQQGKQEGADSDAQAKFESCSAPAKLMLARYPADAGRYVPHLDNDPDDPNHAVGPVGLRAVDRQYTAIIYLNDGWQSDDGGHLRLHRSPAGESAAVIVVDESAAVDIGDTGSSSDGSYEDIEPRGGRLVIFDSRRMLHEVRPSYAPRWAISAWMANTAKSSSA